MHFDVIAPGDQSRGRVNSVHFSPGARSVQPSLTTTMLTRTPTPAVIAGSEARIELGPFFFGPTPFTVHANDPNHTGSSTPWQDITGLAGFDALSWEATALAGFVGEGRTESPLHTLAETVSILATIAEARSQLETAAAGVA